MGNGRAYVFLGSATGLVLGAELAGMADMGEFGWCVAGGGDIDGDGYSDILVGAPAEREGAGRVYAFLGRAGGDVSAPASVLAAVGTDGFGASVAFVGDTDLDGRTDVIVGAPGSFGSGERAIIYRGIDGGVDPFALIELGGPDGGAFGFAVAFHSLSLPNWDSLS